MKFKNFLLNEGRHYLGQKAGDVLTALQNLSDDASNMGSRALVRSCEMVVNQIRRILHGRWDSSDIQFLKKLQKVGVALAKAIDEDDEDMEQVIASGAAEIQELLNDLETPINQIATDDQATDSLQGG